MASTTALTLSITCSTTWAFMDNFPLKTRQHTYGLNLWTEKAARPRAEKQQFEYAYLFGSVVAEEELVRLSLSLG
ncbi:TPA: hypothetical protein JG821_003481 [Vibrio parahaemolyticus]|uniref:hypothetical protein n=1 Tax=Vibrio parahaemolyticus TaxID=670 RepID=UPI0015DE23C9|nr:hypothetical protein [Vibrio parahaemolyticus]ELB2183995.1 hypothetical protein [Vibrio parahaemolyticus]MBE4421200.1 hypothetical protein [Vibrio parahaemolyticus]HAV1515236.1 hypothetical protein [Vibrio parahaemolyticus]HCH0954421.1 hypothetical protein [Vibrio parahaemolyticus]